VCRREVVLHSRTFQASDFFETRRGVCRILAPLTHELAETMTTWAEFAAPVCEQVAKMLARSAQTKVEGVATRLSGANRKARFELAPEPEIGSLKAPTPKAVLVCKRCASPLRSRRRMYCDDCLPHYYDELRVHRCKSCGGKVPNRKRVY
jgi:hypothetical protein